MIDSYGEEIPHPIISERHALFAAAGKSFSVTEAGTIVNGLISAYDTAHTNLPLQDPVESVRIEFGTFGKDTHPVLGVSYPNQQSMKLQVNEDHSFEQIANQIPVVMVHEVAHLAHAQQNFNFFSYDRSKAKAELADVLKEGVAIFAGRVLGEFNKWQTSDLVDTEVERRLSHLLTSETPEAYTSVEVEKKSHYKGRIGEFVVSQHAAVCGLTTEEVMRVSFDEYSDFARALIR